jgi:ketosteroid isomerase-like protein
MSVSTSAASTDGNVVVVEEQMRATLANGNAYDNDYCFEVKGGLVHRVREYVDKAKGNRMVFGAN